MTENQLCGLFGIILVAFGVLYAWLFLRQEKIHKTMMARMKVEQDKQNQLNAAELLCLMKKNEKLRGVLHKYHIGLPN
ncbi:MAG: hypothetical protein ABSG22_10660 [Sedimentisphaerales bacterium]|jgi:hypothetical protein